MISIALLFLSVSAAYNYYETMQCKLSDYKNVTWTPLFQYTTVVNREEEGRRFVQYLCFYHSEKDGWIECGHCDRDNSLLFYYGGPVIVMLLIFGCWFFEDKNAAEKNKKKTA
jgi:hypothetical protein